MTNRFTQSLGKTLKTFINIVPIVLGMLLLTSLVINIFPAVISREIFGRHDFLDALLGASVGSIAVGNPLASYVLGGELLTAGVSMLAVTALIVSWVTVGFVQLPAEALLLGRRFAVYRNLWCFVFAVAVAFFTTASLRLLS